MGTATAIAHPNIALIKYWGKRELSLNLPAVSSLSLTLDGFSTKTTVNWGASEDRLILNDEVAPAKATKRVMAFLDRIDAHRPPVEVISHNDFPTGAGLASSASAFAALAMAATAAKGDELSAKELSVLSRQGSGSACRSLWGGFVQWDRGVREDGTDSHGLPLAPQDHWDVVMVVGVVSTAAKSVGSTEGMERSRLTSPLYETWVEQAEEDVSEGCAAVLARDLPRLGRVMEASTFKMHAAMHTADPPLMYWAPESVACLQALWALRASEGLQAYATMDAGPQVKILCARADAERVAQALRPYTRQTHILSAGGPARLLEQSP